MLFVLSASHFRFVTSGNGLELPTQVAAWSKVKVCSRSIAGTAGSKPADVIDVRLLCLLCAMYVVASATSRSLIQRSPTGYVCLSVCDLETSQSGGLGPIWAVAP
jgi:hypothetical protein